MTEEVTDYEFLDWKKHVFTNDLNCQGALHTALIGPEADIEEGTYIEDTCLEGRTYVGKGAVVSGLSLKDVHIPANTVFHGVKLKVRDHRALRRSDRTMRDPYIWSHG